MIKKTFKKPKKFDYNLVAIGAGSAGLVTAYIANAVKAKVALIEKNKMGGDCLNTGCVPSKALIRSAKFISDIKRAQEFGCRSAHVDFSFAEIMQRVQKIIKMIEPHDSVERYRNMGVECIHGEAKITSPWTITINDTTLTTQNIVIATGAQPSIPAIHGLEKIHYYTSDTIWKLTTLPKKLIILGGGPIGCEFSQCFARFGSQVTQLTTSSRLLEREDDDVSALIMQRFQQQEIAILTHHKAKQTFTRNDQKILVCEHKGKEIELVFDELLIATGRSPNIEGYGLQALDIKISPDGSIETNKFLQTSYPNIFACGDVTGPFQFTHTAAHQAWYATINGLFGAFKKFTVDYSVIPWSTFTDPEIARVGINEAEAKKRNIAYEVTHYDMKNLDRAITDQANYGMLKVLTIPKKDKILGITIVSEHAGEIITEYISAMKNKIGINKILNTIHIYPTLSEANKYLAGNWRRANTPKFLLKWLEKYHTWTRG